MIINGVAGRIDGIISYTDGTWGGFYAILEYEPEEILNSGSDPKDSLGTAYTNYKNAVEDIMESFPFVSSFSWNDIAISKKIKDVVFHVYFLIATDDGRSYPITVTYEKGTERKFNTEIGGDIIAASNINEVLSNIEAMLETVFADITIS